MKVPFFTRCLVVVVMVLKEQSIAMATPIDNTGFDYDNDLLTIVSREEWSARPPKHTKPLEITPTPYIVVHHGGIPEYCHDLKTCSAIARSYQDLHMDDRGWYDIGYSFLIGEDGRAYMGRGWDSIGAHAPGYNTQSIGICVMGDFSDFLPNDAALKALNLLIAHGVAIGKISPDYGVLGHRQARDTLCPGEAFFKYVQMLPHWTVNPITICKNTTT